MTSIMSTEPEANQPTGVPSWLKVILADPRMWGVVIAALLVYMLTTGKLVARDANIATKQDVEKVGAKIDEQLPVLRKICSGIALQIKDEASKRQAVHDCEEK